MEDFEENSERTSPRPARLQLTPIASSDCLNLDHPETNSCQTDASPALELSILPNDSYHVLPGESTLPDGSSTTVPPISATSPWYPFPQGIAQVTSPVPLTLPLTPSTTYRTLIPPSTAPAIHSRIFPGDHPRRPTTFGPVSTYTVQKSNPITPPPETRSGSVNYPLTQADKHPLFTDFPERQTLSSAVSDRQSPVNSLTSKADEARNTQKIQSMSEILPPYPKHTLDSKGVNPIEANKIRAPHLMLTETRLFSTPDLIIASEPCPYLPTTEPLTPRSARHSMLDSLRVANRSRTFRHLSHEEHAQSSFRSRFANWMYRMRRKPPAADRTFSTLSSSIDDAHVERSVSEEPDQRAKRRFPRDVSESSRCLRTEQCDASLLYCFCCTCWPVALLARLFSVTVFRSKHSPTALCIKNLSSQMPWAAVGYGLALYVTVLVFILTAKSITGHEN